MRFSLFFLIFAICILLSACKKSSSDDSCELSMSTLSGDYQMISVISKGSNGEVINQFDTADECVKDNMWTFAPNGYLYVKDIGIQCDGFDINVESWSLSGNDLHFSSGGGGVVKITSFNCNQFSYEGSDSYNGVTYVTTVTFKRY
ncbi:MAG: lipocalin family protein [Chitinophagaceae bacterium]|nr:lipocalin family protein [Chitinophagaceae bacterium]